MPSGIYRIINLVNGNFYVGSTKNSAVRFYRHRNDLRNNRHDNDHLQNAWNLYGEQNFSFVLDRECAVDKLVEEEQRDLTVWYGNPRCYNLSPSVSRPNLGIPRSEETKRKISVGNKGKVNFTVEQRAQMKIDRLGKRHSEETRKKMMGRVSSMLNISKAHEVNRGRIYTDEHSANISKGQKKLYRKNSPEQCARISEGVRRAMQSSNYKKNKIPENERENIKSIYLSKTMNKRQLAFKYGVTPSSMGNYINRMGI